MKTNHSIHTPSIARRVVCAAALSAALMLAAARPALAQTTPKVLPVNSSPHGKSYAEWQAAFWQWAFSLPTANHPLFDETGADAAVGQTGHVWFLGGVFSASGSATRAVTVPAGTMLFFPIINVECSSVEAPPFFGATAEEQSSCAQAFTLGNLACEIDGVAVSNLADYYVVSPQFTFDLPADNILGIPGGVTGATAVSAGVHLMVAPLSKGEHTIRFSGTYVDLDFTLDITYHLTVE